MPLSEVHEELARLLTSPAWTDLVKARISGRVKVLYDKLIDPEENRKERLPDDYIRGFIAACRWILVFPDEEMKQAVKATLAESVPPPEVAPLFGERT